MSPVVRATLTMCLALIAPPAAFLTAGWGWGAVLLWLGVPVLLALVRIGVGVGVPVALHDPLVLTSIVLWWACGIGSAWSAARLPRETRFPAVAALAVGAVYMVVARVLLLAPTSYVERVDVQSVSMAPGLLPGDAVLAARAPFMGPVQAGDVVVLRVLADDPLAPEGGHRWIKRVVATEGQRVGLRDGVVYVDGAPLRREPAPRVHVPSFVDGCGLNTHTAVLERHGDRWATVLPGNSQAGGNRPTLRVPEGHIYVLGDDRDRSMDSRRIGPVPVSAVEAEVKGIASPIAMRPCPRFDLSRLGDAP